MVSNPSSNTITLIYIITYKHGKYSISILYTPKMKVMKIDQRHLGQQASEMRQKKSAIWSTDEIEAGETKPCRNFSLTIWQSISICLVRSWNTGFLVICIAAWLLQNKKIGVEETIWKAPSRIWSQTSSPVVEAKALY